MKSERNKTIDMTVDEGRKYLDRCLYTKDVREGILPVDSVICGDTLEVSPLLPPESVDLLIADPPYNMSKDFGESSFRRTDAESYREYTAKWLAAVFPLLKKNASVYVCCDWQSSGIVGDVLGGMMTVRSRITWQREKGRGAKANWKNAAEDIWFATVSNDYTFNIDAVKLRRRVIAPYRDNGQPKDWDETADGRWRDTCPSNFWDDISVPYWSMPENTAHPTQKPEKLIAKLILAGSSEGDVVFDPFLGSGTTAVTAKKLGRHFCGVELNPQYCVWAQKRLEMADSDSSIQGYTDGVFWERNTYGEQGRIRRSSRKK